MLSRTQIVERLHRLKHYSFISYCYLTSNNNHVVILRDRVTTLEHLHAPTKDVVYIVQECENYLLAQPFDKSIGVFKLEQR